MDEALHSSAVLHQASGPLGIRLEGILPIGRRCRAEHSSRVENVGEIIGQVIEVVPRHVLFDAGYAMGLQLGAVAWIREPRHAEHLVVLGELSGDREGHLSRRPRDENLLSR